MGKSRAVAKTAQPVEKVVRFIILSSMLIAPLRADPETRLLAYGCSPIPNYNATLFEKNLKAALASVVRNVVQSGFATRDPTDLADSVYALAQCRKDKSSTDCMNCIKVAEKQVRNCSNVSGGRAFYDGCFLRYENANFYYEYTDPGNKQRCGDANALPSNLFSATGRSLISDLCTATPRINGYFAAQTRQGPSNTTIYGLASCLRSLSEGFCKNCLSIAQANINKCFPCSEGRAVDAGCYLRYGSKPFFPRNATIELAPFLSKDPETKVLAYGCSPVSNNNATLFQQNLNAALASVVEEVASSGFATKDEVRVTDLEDSVYAMAQCRKDKSSANCVNCIKMAEKQVRNCSNVNGARAIYDGCFLRFENRKFYDFYSDTADKEGRQGPSDTVIYGLAWCLRSLSKDFCKKCLNIAQTNINKCFPRSEGRALNAGCYLRYDSNPFFPSNATTDLAPFLATGKVVSSTVWIIIGIVGGIFLLCLLFFRKQILRYLMRPGQKQVDTEGATELRGPGDFDFKILKKATNNFDQANKLGEGGFGEVYKGTLKNGKVVAVKKLTLGRSARAVSEFESEVKLISNVHHRNLVRLLGCCRQGPERLLVYEYMPNSSLDRILFGELKNPLSWNERFNIILGTARGLAYLHEEFHVCIIHRDIKASNILLDENFHAKIADFGLARLLPNDKSHVSTRFAGTLGYTAPEYASHGQLTEKADTYSYGVVVLEVVSGRKSIDLKQPPHMQYLLEWVWRLYEENRVLELVDSEGKMEGYSLEEVVRVINLALLCIQTCASHRPSLSEVVTMLLSKAEIDFQKPLQPAFVDVGYKVQGECPTSSPKSNATITESLNAR